MFDHVNYWPTQPLGTRTIAGTILSGMKRAGSPECAAWQLLVRFFFTQRAHLPTLGAELDLSPAQCHVLHLIEPDRPIPMGQLAETLACDASNVTGLVDRLESRGLVRRRPSPGDRRVKVLHLTAGGIRLRALLVARMTAPPAALERLSAREQQELVRILTRLLEK
jgi:DNA-binding MarR family transcriptional regulator